MVGIHKQLFERVHGRLGLAMYRLKMCVFSVTKEWCVLSYSSGHPVSRNSTSRLSRQKKADAHVRYVHRLKTTLERGQPEKLFHTGQGEQSLEM